MSRDAQLSAGRGISRRRLLGAAGAAGTALMLPRSVVRMVAAPRGDGAVVRWNEAFLQGVRESKLGPPMVARALAVAHTCMFDAWAAYDEKAVGTRLGGSLRRPAAERTLANTIRALSFAAYRAAVDLFPASASSVFDPLMRGLGYDPGDLSADVSTPTGIGNVAARAVLDFRHRDGANQLGDEVGAVPGVPYADYTGFQPANDPMDLRAPFDPATVREPSSWQPLRYVEVDGQLITQRFVGAQWQRVAPFAVRPGALRSATGPARYGSAEYRAQAEAMLDISARLTDEHKAIAEYWADGPRSELPPGHWNLFAQLVARRDHHGPRIDRDVKLFFALTNAIMDAGCCAWNNKCAFDSVRPITAARYLFGGTTVRAWAGPYRGARRIDGAAWLPYQPTTFPTPPFPEYSSGHSAFSAAGAEILRLFTHSNRFGASTTVPAGSSRVEPGAVPQEDIRLAWATFSEAADQAGISRRYGGIHFEQGDLDGRSAGRIAARVAWRTARQHWEGG
jgi:hypothetical protein